MRLIKLILVVAVILFSVFFIRCVSFSATSTTTVKVKELENYIKSKMKISKIPGISVVIVEGNKTVYKKGFGFSEEKAHKCVTPDTLFELGSTSKAFTGLAVLQLEDNGLLNLDDSVTEYLPWFKMNYHGKAADIKLSQLLHHTSGIPFKSIGSISVAEDEDALEKTVRTLIGGELDSNPGEKYQYATINYDVLGLIIQKVSGQSYEKYIEDSILKPLGLNHTYLFRQEAALHDMAKGYKLKLLGTVEYDAPMYRGNTPAGYFIANGEDMAKWIKLQLGTEKAVGFNYQLIEKSHLPDRSVSPAGDGSSYAAGWSVYQSGSGEISHGGNNPNFSSFIAFRPRDGVGVAILANLNSSYTQVIGQGIMNILQGKKLPEDVNDMYNGLNNAASAIIFITLPIITLILWFTFISVMQLIRKERRFGASATKAAGSMAVFIIFMAGFAFCLYKIPDVMFWGLNWGFVKVWAPQSLIFAVISLFTAVLLFNTYFIFTLLFPKDNDKSLFLLTILSITSGFGNALIIFVVNETLNRDDGFQGGLLIYFVLGIAIYVFGQKLVRTRLINVANNMVYQKRSELIDKILNSSFQKIESMEYGKIQASLNNDTEVISDFSNIVITGATSLVTLICCFVYMGIINIFGLLASILFIFMAAGLYFLIGKQANRLWEETRDIQNVFFKFINDLICGFKELSIHESKNNDFKRDMQDSCNSYREKRIKGDLKFANVSVIGELLFTLIIGAVAFIFPVIFKDLKINSLKSYVFFILYMTGPIHGILGAIPSIFKVRVSWNRINELSSQLDSIKEDEGHQQKIRKAHEHITVELNEVEYQYKNGDGESFSVGPIKCSFKSGEITFITGGNGSGKSTLAKLITGLYIPSSGEIRLNGEKVTAAELGQKYSAVYSEFHLFEKLYGIDYTAKKEDIEKYLAILRINDKVKVEDGVFSTVQLSTGQRKRLALLVSYLEDRPIYLFDEWAADQDPKFRKFFYHTLLPELRDKGKCIIAITHDDRYFGVADNILKMDMGKLLSMEAHGLNETG